MKTKINRVGEEFYNKLGYHMIIVEYESYENVTVKFDDGVMVKTNYNAIKNGAVKNKNAPSVFGHGVIGNSIVSKNGKPVKEYQVWESMLNRCFSDKYKSKKPTYKDATCCEEWLNYNNFIEWLHKQENYDYCKNNDDWQLDKDILYKGNKMYAPDRCVIVPRRINSLFRSSHKHRGSYPIGVTYDKQGNKFISQCKCNGTKITHRFTTVMDAFLQYKKDRENEIRKVANEEFYKGSISEKCYKAMINYSVEITD